MPNPAVSGLKLLRRPRAGSAVPQLFTSLAALFLPSACILDLPPALDDDATAPPLSVTGPEPEPVPTTDSDTDSSTDSDPPMTVPSEDAAVPGGSGGVPIDAGGGAGAGNSAGMNPGGGSGGGGNGGEGGVPSMCNAPLIECNGTCITAGEPCCLEDCSVAFPHAAGECVGNVCVMGECEANFINCDSDIANGCEADFTFTQVSGTTMTAPRVNLAQDDPWANVPLVQLAAPCADCVQSDSRIPQVAPADRDPPPSTDLRAGFALGWNDTFLYLHARVFDDSIPDAPAVGDARNYDNIEFLFDGDPAMINGQDDQHIFLAHDGAASDLNANTSLDEVVAVSAERVGSCYWLTASLSTAFLSGLREGGEPNVQLSNLAIFAFDVGISDYDLTDALNPLSIDHQSHLFFRDPKNNYWFGTRVFPSVQLVGMP